MSILSGPSILQYMYGTRPYRFVSFFPLSTLFFSHTRSLCTYTSHPHVCHLDLFLGVFIPLEASDTLTFPLLPRSFRGRIEQPHRFRDISIVSTLVLILQN
jgi:hypothetical protein